MKDFPSEGFLRNTRQFILNDLRKQNLTEIRELGLSGLVQSYHSEHDPQYINLT